jgi:hypothetical protein
VPAIDGVITLQRAAAWMREHGCGPTEAVMTDNAFAYTNSRAFQAVLDDLGARHIRIPPYTPRWNGKVERVIQTLDTEWAHSRVWASSAQRDRALSCFLATTTADGHTAASTTGHPSAAFTTLLDRTASAECPRRP